MTEEKGNQKETLKINTSKLPSNRFASAPKATKAIATNKFIMRTTPAFGTFAITYIYEMCIRDRSLHSLAFLQDYNFFGEGFFQFHKLGQ